MLDFQDEEIYISIEICQFFEKKCMHCRRLWVYLRPPDGAEGSKAILCSAYNKKYVKLKGML